MHGSITTGSCVIILIIGSLFYHDIGLLSRLVYIIVVFSTVISMRITIILR